MEDRGGDTGRSRSDSKLAGEKRTSGELGEKSEVARKKIKMRNLESVLRFEEVSSNHLKNKEDDDSFQFTEKMSQVTNVPVTLDFNALSSRKKWKDRIYQLRSLLPLSPLGSQ
uniref:Uncharacterized protein n=1 Tax=Populus alba TaxID=43335 RepID=A0A4U5QYY0_POPAL|nr:hypothetical protein D5086_0000021900 [Populus alba]